MYTQALLKALELIKKDMNDGKDPRDTWLASGRRIFLKDDLPEPKFCDAEYCIVNESPECLNYELPTFGKWGARTEAPDGDLNPYKGENQNWSIWHAPNDIWYMVNGDDVAYFQNRDDQEICRHLDACGGITAQTVADGMVVFRLPKMTSDLWSYTETRKDGKMGRGACSSTIRILKSVSIPFCLIAMKWMFSPMASAFGC